jgi:succinyl-CoA synthetase beta subunit
VASAQEAESAAREILGMTVKEMPVRQVLVSEKMEICHETYAAVTVDRDSKSVVLIFSDAGGVDIEEIAVHSPEKIRQLTLAGARTSGVEELSRWLSESIPEPELLAQAVSICRNMVRLFGDKDCALVEINPLAVLPNARLAALDAKIVLDDNGLAKHPEMAQFKNPEEYTADEQEARAAGLSFVSLSGQTGCMVNGAGLAMATMDCIQLAGGSPANFLDVGGSSNPRKIINGLRILQNNPDIKSILINIFGGITRCDDVAEGILQARSTLGLTVPLVIRLIGTNEEKGHAMLGQAGIAAYRDMHEAILEAVRLARKGATR